MSNRRTSTTASRNIHYVKERDQYSLSQRLLEWAIETCMRTSPCYYLGFGVAVFSVRVACGNFCYLFRDRRGPINDSKSKASLNITPTRPQFKLNSHRTRLTTLPFGLASLERMDRHSTAP